MRETALQAERGAKASDARLTGDYVIVMDCATCDLGSDISHGHYAGWDKERERVRNLLRGAAKCFLRGCEEKGLIHGDIKPMNIVLSTEAGAPVIKLIDFDASARHGEPCHLKYSSAFAPPQLAAELLEYEEYKAETPDSREGDIVSYYSTDRADVQIICSYGQTWAEWSKARGNLKASPQVDIWAFGALAFKMAVKDGASIFHSTEADNIVKREDLETLAYGWEQRKLAEMKRVVWALSLIHI